MMPRVPGVARHGELRCRPGTVAMCGGPGLAAYRIRDE